MGTARSRRRIRDLMSRDLTNRVCPLGTNTENRNIAKGRSRRSHTGNSVARTKGKKTSGSRKHEQDSVLPFQARYEIPLRREVEGNGCGN
jgi:hypothetical protein